MSKQWWGFDMSFAERVVKLRKKKVWTQQTLAEHVGVKVLQIRRYENGSSQPTLEVIKQLAIALSVTTDQLVFAQDEREPIDDLKLQFEALGQFDDDERKVAKRVASPFVFF